MDFSFEILDASEESGLSDGMEVWLPWFNTSTTKAGMFLLYKEGFFTETESCFEFI
ncbi:hypothetical protein ACLB1R_36090 [Escherichia coli]